MPGRGGEAAVPEEAGCRFYVKKITVKNIGRRQDTDVYVGFLPFLCTYRWNFFLNFEIDLLGSTAIVGQNGSGKTTLAKFSSSKFYEIRLYFLESIAYNESVINWILCKRKTNRCS